jgi:hypothetical protein
VVTAFMSVSMWAYSDSFKTPSKLSKPKLAHFDTQV